MSVDPVWPLRTLGQAGRIAATPRDPAGNQRAGRAVTWSSNDPDLATVSESALARGALARGDAVIGATSERESGAGRRA